MRIPDIATTYVTAVHAALAQTGLPPSGAGAPEPTGPGDYPAIDNIINLDEDSGLAEDRWLYGLTVIWEWHNPDGTDEHPEGPFWRWGKVTKGGRLQPLLSGDLPDLPVDGFAAPGVVAATVRQLADTGAPGPALTERWDRADELAAALGVWAAAEVAEYERSVAGLPGADV
jgi:hypothetical protein